MVFCHLTIIFFGEEGKIGMTNTQKKQIMISSISIGILLIIVLLIMLFQAQQKKQKIAEATVIAKKGEAVVLNNKEDEKGQAFDFMAALPWDGEIQLTLDKAVLYNSYLDADIDVSKVIEEDREGQFMFCTFTIRNVSVADRIFNVGFIRLKNDKERPEATYFSEAKYSHEDSAKHDYYNLSVETGSESTFQLGFFLKEKTSLNDEWMVALGTSSAGKYMIQFTPE